jgi:PadR family transcriptional regulator
MGKENFEERAIKSMLDIAVLSVLANKPKHGYAVITHLAKKTGVLIGAGVIYPLLYELESKGFVEGEWTSPERRTRRMYSITKKGRLHLEDGYNAIDKTLRLIRDSAKP